jgi:hypothetical protein
MPIDKGELDVVAVHPMASVPMGDDPQRAPVGSGGKHHHLQNLWVADGSLFPSSIGVPPQLSIYLRDGAARGALAGRLKWMARGRVVAADFCVWTAALLRAIVTLAVMKAIT